MIGLTVTAVVNMAVLDAMMLGLKPNTEEAVQATAELIETDVKLNIIAKHIIDTSALLDSIRFGKIGVQRTNPDYFKFAVLNTVLGGFFGSRLQKNIREEKGFTYGISSSNVALQRAAYWIVGTDVNKANADQTVEEIQKEIKKLQTELIPEAELNLVKNYLMGSFVGELTQAFEISEKVKIICLENLPNDFYDQFQSQILSCTSKDLIELANIYWEENQLFDIRVG